MSEVQPEAPIEEPTEEWTGPSQDEWTQMQESLQGIAPVLEMYQQYQQEAEQFQNPEQQQPAPPQFDPFADNAGDQMREIIRTEIQQATAPLTDLYSQVQYEQLEEQARDILGDYKQANDIEFSGEGADDWVLAQADKLAPQMAERYGQGIKAAEAAIAEAANSLRDYETKVGEAYYEQQTNQLTTLSGAPRQPSPAGASTQNLAAPTGGPAAVVAKYYPR